MKHLRGIQKLVTQTLLLVSLTVVANAAEVNTTQQARVQHAKELLGNRYQRTIANIVDDHQSVKGFVEKMAFKSLPKKWKNQAAKIAQTIIEQSAKYGFDPVFLVAVIQTESSFSPVARGTSGEIGLMQLMPNTGEWIARRAQIPWKGAKMLFDPVSNIQIGAAYLAQLREKFGSDGRLYIPAYNMGAHKLKLAVAQQVIPREYAKRVMKKYLRFYSQIQSGFLKS
jgi:soluble lytic murein transglycosylase